MAAAGGDPGHGKGGPIAAKELAESGAGQADKQDNQPAVVQFGHGVDLFQFAADFQPIGRVRFNLIGQVIDGGDDIHVHAAKTDQPPRARAEFAAAESGDDDGVGGDEGVDPVAAQAGAQVVDGVFGAFGVGAVLQLELAAPKGEIDNIAHFGAGNGWFADGR